MDENNQTIGSLSKYKYTDKFLKDTKVNGIGLSLRALNVLERSGIESLEELFEVTPYQLMNFRNAGRQTFSEIMSLCNIDLRDTHPINMNSKASLESCFKIDKRFYEYKIQAFLFSIRTFNCLKRAGIETIERLLDFSCDMQNIRNLGKVCNKEILDVLKELQIISSNDNCEFEFVKYILLKFFDELEPKHIVILEGMADNLTYRSIAHKIGQTHQSVEQNYHKLVERFDMVNEAAGIKDKLCKHFGNENITEDDLFGLLLNGKCTKSLVYLLNKDKEIENNES